jgi:CRISPR/Cas system CMR subunit Cmr4 (Cas7 group RAMP superfamily)
MRFMTSTEELVDMVSTETIRTCVKCAKITVQQRGAPPILPKSVEKLIAEIELEMQKIQQPLSETIKFAKSLIEGSEYQEKIKQWKTSMVYLLILLHLALAGGRVSIYI